MTEDQIANIIIGVAIDIHKELGPGLLESAYKECMFYNIQRLGFLVEKERAMPLIYKNLKLECGYRIDLLIEKKLVLEIKSVDALNDIHLAQTLTYLKIGNYKLGLLINFNVILLKNGIKRLINGSL